MFQCLALIGLVGLVLLGWVATGAVENDDNADCIVVLGAAVRKGRTPSDALQYRLDTALALYENGRAPTIIVTGAGEGNYAEAEVMSEWLVDHGVPQSAILIDNESATTRESGKNVAHLMKQRRWKTALVVSQWFHVARSRMALSQEGIDTIAAPCDGNTLRKEPYFVCREMLALPAYAMRFDELRET